MSKTKTAVLIGGASDGKRFVLEEWRDSLQMAVLNSENLADLEIRKELYRSMRIAGGSQIFEVFVLQGMPDDEAMRRLIDGYKNNESR